MAKRLLLLSGALLIAATSGGWIHGIAANPNYANWREALANIPCEQIVKDGKDLRVVGTITVDGKTYQNHVVTSHEEIEAVDDRCHLKG